MPTQHQKEASGFEYVLNAPGLSGQADYRPFFRVLKDGGYAGSIAVEAGKFDVAADGARVLAFVRDQWDRA